MILLAAGVARRLKPLTDGRPKCLLEVGGRSMISRAVDILAGRGLRHFTVVDGFCGDLLRRALAAEFPPGWFRFVRNEDYETTNNAVSLQLARYDGEEPMFLLDSDLVFEPAVVDRLLDDRHANRLALRTRGALGEEEMKVRLGPDGRVIDLDKGVEPARAAGESMGLEVFSAAFARRLFDTLDRRVSGEAGRQEFYEASFVELIRAGLTVHPVPLGDLECVEIDTPADLERARSLFGRGGPVSRWSSPPGAGPGKAAADRGRGGS